MSSDRNENDYYLFLSTTNGNDFVALHQYDRVLVKHEIETQNVCEKLPTLLLEILSDFNVEITDLKRIILNIGPGNLTSIKTVIAFAKGLTCGTEIDIVPLHCTYILAAAFHREHSKSIGDSFVSVVAKNNNTVYYQVFSKELLVMSEINACHQDDITDIVKLHNSSHCVNNISNYQIISDAIDVKYNIDSNSMFLAASNNSYNIKHLSIIEPIYCYDGL